MNTLLHGINFKPCFYLVTVELLAPNPYMIDGGLEAQYKHNVFVVWWCECSVSGLGLVLGDGVVEWGGGLGGGCLLCPGRSLVIPPMLPPATCPDPHYPPPLSSTAHLPLSHHPHLPFPCLLSVFAMDNTAAQRFDITEFQKGNPSENLVLSNRPCLLPSFSMDNTAAQRIDSTKFSERQPFRTFGAFEPPWIAQQRSSLAPSFGKKNTLQKIWCYRTVFAMDNTAAQRFDSTKFYERKPFGKFGAIEPPLFVFSI